MKSISSYAPVIIPTLNRFDHFKRCFESLEKCTGADKTTLFVGLDYPPSEKYREGWCAIDAYLQEKEMNNIFQELIVMRRPHNYGVGGVNSNARVLFRDVFDRFDRCIFSEDDNVYSPCFLDYMNKCLEEYKDNPKVRTVAGYTHPMYYSINKPLLFTYDCTAWGFGLWREKELEFSSIPTSYYNNVLNSLSHTLKLYFNYPLLLSNLLSMVLAGKSYGDTKRTCLNIMNDTYQVRPYVSLVKNIGVDGTGEHCKADDQAFFENQEILDLKLFPFEKMEPSLSVSKRKMWKFSLTPNTMNKIKIILASLYFYVKYRLKGSNK